MPPESVRRPSALHVAIGAAFSLTMVVLGQLAVGTLVAIVFSTGFVLGWVLWVAVPDRASFDTLKVPYVVALVAYAVHRTEEEVADFVGAIERLTGDQAVDVVSPVSVTLVVLSVAWMLSPLLVRWGHPLGYYGAWTLFAGFGVLELAHFVFPLMTPEPYGYFPGMWTVPLIAASGWWGMWRLWRGDRREEARVGVPATGSDSGAASD